MDGWTGRRDREAPRLVLLLKLNRKATLGEAEIKAGSMNRQRRTHGGFAQQADTTYDGFQFARWPAPSPISIPQISGFYRFGVESNQCLARSTANYQLFP